MRQKLKQSQDEIKTSVCRSARQQINTILSRESSKAQSDVRTGNFINKEDGIIMLVHVTYIITSKGTKQYKK